MADEKKKTLVSAAQERQIRRTIMIWVNTWGSKPAGTIHYESLEADVENMAVLTVQSPYITKRYINGGYQAQFRFDLAYRVQPGASDDKRLQADELLDDFGDWAAANLPNLGDGIRVRRCEAAGRAGLVQTYENGDEDHLITLNLTYEVF